MVEFFGGALFGGFVGATLLVLRPSWFDRFRRAVGSPSGTTAFDRKVMDEVRREQPALADVIERPSVVPVDAVPSEIDAAEVNAPESEKRLAGIRDPHLVRFLSALRGWRPASRTYGDERGFANSMVWHLTHKGDLVRADISEEPRLQLELGGASKPLKPDFIFWGHLLVEVKGDVDSSSTSDRSLGQLFRYLLAWKARGASVLVICGYCDPVLKLLIRQYVGIWRERFGLPVTVFFAGSENVASVPVETTSTASL